MMANYSTWISFSLTLLLMVITDIKSQDNCNADAHGKHFIIAFPENFEVSELSKTELHILIVSFQNTITQVDVSSPHRLSNNSFFRQNVFVQPMNFARVIVPNELELIGTERNNKTIEIKADSEISVHVLHLEPSTTGGYLAIPTDHFGTQYVVASVESAGSLFTIIGSQDNTNAKINLKSRIRYENTDYAPGEILEIQLSRLEAFQINSIVDLTGTIIISDKPISVISGHSCASTPNLGCDVLLEQSIPVSNWGTRHFLTAPLRNNAKITYRMLAFYDNTEFTVRSQNYRINSGGYQEFEFQGNGIIVTTKPASLIQILTQIESYVDPSMINLPSENQFALRLGFTTPPHPSNHTVGFNNYVNIIVKSSERSSLRLNGKAVANNNSTQIVYETNIPNSDYRVIAVRLPSPEGVYIITQSIVDYSPMSAIVYGYEDKESYGYLTGLSLVSNLGLPPTVSPTCNTGPYIAGMVIIGFFLVVSLLINLLLLIIIIYLKMNKQDKSEKGNKDYQPVQDQNAPPDAPPDARPDPDERGLTKSIRPEQK